MGRGPTPSYYKSMHEDYVQGTLTCLRPEVVTGRTRPDFPLVLNLEPTSRCNLKCWYCPRQKAAKQPGDMDFDLYKRLVDEAAERGLIMFNLHKDGEPFLHPRLPDMAAYARKKNVAGTVRLNTNGMFLDEERVAAILDSGLDDMTVSIDAARPGTFKRLKGLDGLGRVERGVMRLLEERARRGQDKPFVRAKIMEFDRIERAEIDEFHRRWQGVADQVQVTGVHSWSGAVDLDVTDEKSGTRYPCMLMWYAMAVDHTGSSTFCSVDWNTELDLGDVRRMGIAGAFSSMAARIARQSQVDRDWGRYQICRDCAVWVSCGDLSGFAAGAKEFLAA